MDDSVVAIPGDCTHDPSNVLQQQLYSAHDTLYSALRLTERTDDSPCPAIARAPAR